MHRAVDSADQSNFLGWYACCEISKRMEVGKVGRMIVTGLIGNQESVERIKHDRCFSANLLADSREV